VSCSVYIAYFKTKYRQVTHSFNVKLAHNSRVTSKQGLKILIVDEDGDNITIISNVIYHEVFRNVF